MFLLVILEGTFFLVQLFFILLLAIFDQRTANFMSMGLLRKIENRTEEVKAEGEQWRQSMRELREAIYDKELEKMHENLPR